MRELSLHILDIVQNSLAAGARNVEIFINEDTKEDTLVIEVEDDGFGMDEDAAKNALDPFWTTRKTRHVGLGLPMFKAAAEHCGGSFQVWSKPNVGTRVTAAFQRSHIDRAPLGDMAGTLLGLIACNPDLNFRFRHLLDGKRVELDTSIVREQLGDIPLNYPEVLSWIGGYLRDQYKTLEG